MNPQQHHDMERGHHLPQEQFELMPHNRIFFDGTNLIKIYAIPPSIATIIKNHARIMAGKWCKANFLRLTNEELEQNKADGIIPKQFISKFKHLFTEPDQAGFRQTAVEMAIDYQTGANIDKMNELFNEIANALTTLTTDLNPVLQTCNLQIAPIAIREEFEFHYQSFKAEFLLKQQSDAKKKAAKQQKFALAKEASLQEVTLTQKDKSKMEGTIKALQRDLAKLKLETKKSGKGKGSATKSPTAGPKTKKNPKQGKDGKNQKTTKNKGGKKQDSAKNK